MATPDVAMEVIKDHHTQSNYTQLQTTHADYGTNMSYAQPQYFMVSFLFHLLTKKACYRLRGQHGK